MHYYNYRKELKVHANFKEIKRCIQLSKNKSNGTVFGIMHNTIKL